MNRLRVASVAALAGAAALLAFAVATGEARVGLFLVVPFVVGSGLVPLVAMLLLLAAFVLWVLGSSGRTTEGRESSGRPLWPPGATNDDADGGHSQRTASSGGVVLLGPIPIVWGSDRRILPWMIAAGAALLALGLLVYLVGLRAR